MEQERDLRLRLIDFTDKFNDQKNSLNGLRELIGDSRDNIPNDVAFGIALLMDLWWDKMERIVTDFIETEKRIHGIS